MPCSMQTKEQTPGRPGNLRLMICQTPAYIWHNNSSICTSAYMHDHCMHASAVISAQKRWYVATTKICQFFFFFNEIPNSCNSYLDIVTSASWNCILIPRPSLSFPLLSYSMKNGRRPSKFHHVSVTNAIERR